MEDGGGGEAKSYDGKEANLLLTDRGGLGEESIQWTIEAPLTGNKYTDRGDI